jgi:hypothetical protein
LTFIGSGLTFIGVASLLAFPSMLTMAYSVFGMIGQPMARSGDVILELTNGLSAGTSQIRAEHLKEWYQRTQQEEDPDPDAGAQHATAGDKCCVFVQLVQAIWDKGKIPISLGWITTGLIPKGGGNYCDIGLLKPIWKVMEHVMDHRLKTIILHNSLHG